MNHFFALRLSEEAIRTVQEVADEWRPLVMRSSWYDPADYHITLKFLGNLNEMEQPRLVAAAEPIAQGTRPFTVRPAPYGGFPNMAAPDVLWAGVQLSPELDVLAAHLDQAMSSIGLRADRRRYHPHITVARCRLRTTRIRNTPHGLAARDWPLPAERLFAPFEAGQFVLLQTRSGEGRANRTGFRYNTVHTFPLAGAQVSDVS